MAKHGLLAVPDSNQGHGKVSIARQEKIFPFTSAGAYKPEGGSPLQEGRNIIFPSVSFKSRAYLHRLKF